MRRTRILLGVAVVVAVAAGLGVSGALPGSQSPVFDGVTPVRILDTREGLGAPKAPIGPGQSIDVTVAGANGIPPEATSVVMNVTAVGATQVTHLTVWPTGQTRPNASNLNPANGNATPNLVTVAIGVGGQVSIYNNSGSVHVIADVVGYYRDHNHDDRYYTEAELEAMLAGRDSTVSSLADRVGSLESTVSSLSATTTSTTPPLPTPSGEYVALGVGNKTWYSFNGGTLWAVSPTPPDGAARAVATDGAGMWVAVGPTGTKAWKSSDGGKNWAPASTPPNGEGFGLATDGNGRWVAVGHTGAKAWYSNDNGDTWTPSPAPPNGTPEAIATDGQGQWVAVGSGGSAIWRSVDGGATWVGAAAPVGFASRSIATDGQGVWITGAANAKNAWRSEDNGQTWTAAAIPPNGEDIYSLTTDGNGTWLAVGHGIPHRSWVSTDNGVIWLPPSIQPPESTGAATDGSDTWVVVGPGSAGSRAGYSLDPSIEWLAPTVEPGDAAWAVAEDRLLP